VRINDLHVRTRFRARCPRPQHCRGRSQSMRSTGATRETARADVRSQRRKDQSRLINTLKRRMDLTNRSQQCWARDKPCSDLVRDIEDRYSRAFRRYSQSCLRKCQRATSCAVVSGALPCDPVLGSQKGFGPDAWFVRFSYQERAGQLARAWQSRLDIAVRNRSELDGFVSWSSKEGVPHVSTYRNSRA